MMTGSELIMKIALLFNSFLNALDAIRCDTVKDNTPIPSEEPVFW
jgi:hypothetical protein